MLLVSSGGEASLPSAQMFSTLHQEKFLKTDSSLLIIAGVSGGVKLSLDGDTVGDFDSSEKGELLQDNSLKLDINLLKIVVKKLLNIIENN